MKINDITKAIDDSIKKHEEMYKIHLHNSYNLTSKKDKFYESQVAKMHLTFNKELQKLKEGIAEIKL